MIRFVLALALFAAPVGAQTWTASTFANGSLLFGGVSPPEWSMGFGCTAPAPEGRPLIETGSHESHRTEAFEITVGFLDSLFQWSPPYEISGIVISVDDVSYQMPPLGLNELQGSAIYLPMTDQFVLALFDAQRLVLDTGQGTAYEYPVDGLSDALTTAFGYCVDRWAEMGHTIPVELNRFWPAVVEEEATAPIQPALPSRASQVPQFIRDAAVGSCSAAGFSINADHAVSTADLDGDGTVDYVLNMGGVRCTEGMNLSCGAANCSIDVFLSSQGYARRDAFLGMSAGLVELNDGRTGVQISGTYSLCGETGLCPGPVVWTGSEFSLAGETDEPPEMPQFIVDRVAQGCSAAGFVIDHGVALGQADFDQDGQPDYVFNGAGVRCYEGVNPFCGASACSIDIHLSSRNYEIVDGYIGLDFEIQTASDGRPALVLQRSPTQPLSVWDGTAFVPAPEAGPQK